jgi:hypothetical protein
MMLGGSVSISLVCVSISILGEINQATLDSTLAPVVLNSAYPFPEYTVPFQKVCHSERYLSILEDSNWFYQPRLEILEKKGTELGAVITTSFRNG